MFKQWWDVPGVGQICLADPTRDILNDADDVWPSQRRSSDLHRHWRWLNLMRDKPERFALVDRWNLPVALWCSAMKRPLQLREASCYRLDYFEVHPKLRGGALGHFAFTVIAARALETESEGLVLGAIPSVQKFYLGLGGQKRLVDGWKVARGLVPFFFARETLANLKEMADAYLVED